MKIKWEGILGCLEPKTDCRYYHGSGLFDKTKIIKFLNCQILMTICTQLINLYKLET